MHLSLWSAGMSTVIGPMKSNVRLSVIMVCLIKLYSVKLWMAFNAAV